MTFASLLDRAAALAAGPRRLLGIVGAPGAGKSTLAARLVAALGAERAVLVPMDGFHLAQAELERLGRAERKGAVDTFDGDGFVALLGRLATGGATVYAPEFRREIEEPIAGAIPVPPDVPLVVTEGNYLLVPGPRGARSATCWTRRGTWRSTRRSGCAGWCRGTCSSAGRRPRRGPGRTAATRSTPTSSRRPSRTPTSSWTP